MSGVRCVVWGLGPHARKNLLPAFSAVRGLTLRGVCSRSAATVAELSAKYGCEGWTDAADMLSRPDVDAVFIATPSGLHAEHARRALIAGKHAWCDKPFATTLRAATDNVALSRQAGLTVAEGFMYLHHPQFQYLQDTLSSGRIGKVLGFTCRFGIPPLERPGFRTDPALGGGAFLDVGVYPVSAAVALFPAEAPEVLFACSEVAPGSVVDTSGAAYLRWPPGVTGMLEWRTHSAYRNEIDIWGSEGSVYTDRLFSKPAEHVARFRFSGSTGEQQEESVPAASQFAGMFEWLGRLPTDETLAERERQEITRRAMLLDAIWRTSRS